MISLHLHPSFHTICNSCKTNIDRCDRICYQFRDHFLGQWENEDNLLEQTCLVDKILPQSNRVRFYSMLISSHWVKHCPWPKRRHLYFIIIAVISSHTPPNQNLVSHLANPSESWYCFLLKTGANAVTLCVISRQTNGPSMHVHD